MTDAEGNRIVKIPAWALGLLKAGIPMLMVLITAYVGYRILQEDVCKLKEEVPEIQKSVEEIRLDCYRHKTEADAFKRTIGDTMKRIESSIDKLDGRVESIQATQQEVKLDVRVIQQKLELEKSSP